MLKRKISPGLDMTSKHKHILIIGDMSYSPIKYFQNQIFALVKGFIQAGHDARVFNHVGEMARVSRFKSRKLSRLFYKKKVDHLLCDLCKHYEPNLIYINFPRYFDYETLLKIRKTIPNTVLLGMDGDPWLTRNASRRPKIE